jgi:tetratricopeptide (TPR) repeat protein
VKQRLLGIFVIIILSLSAVAEPPDTTRSAQLSKKQLRNQVRKVLKETIRYVDNGIYDSALTLTDSILLLDSASADAYFLKGWLLAQQGDTSRAIEVLTAGTAAVPLSSRVKLLLARLLIASGQIDEAETLLDAVLAIKPHEGEALYLKGQVVLTRGDSTKAMDLFEQAIDIALSGRKL